MDELENINPFQILAKSLARIEKMLVCLMENTDLNLANVPPQQPQLLSITEAARFLGLSKQAVYRHIGKYLITSETGGFILNVRSWLNMLSRANGLHANPRQADGEQHFDSLSF